MDLLQAFGKEQQVSLKDNVLLKEKVQRVFVISKPSSLLNCRGFASILTVWQL